MRDRYSRQWLLVGCACKRVMSIGWMDVCMHWDMEMLLALSCKQRIPQGMSGCLQDR